jgi:site-specific recombinase XerD
MPTLIEDFEREYQRYHGITPKRAKEQLGLLVRLESGLNGRALTDVTADDFQALLGDLVDEGLHVNTVRKKANMVRPFFSWAYAKGAITGEQYMRLKAVKDPRGATGHSKPRPYKRKELDLFFAAVEERLPLLPETGPGSQLIGRWLSGKGARWWSIGRHAMRLQIDAIVALALHCGLRRAEIFQLKPDDLHYDNEYIVVTGKGGKVREVPFTEQARMAVQRWLDFRLQVMRPECEETWLACRGPRTYRQPMTFLRFEELLRRVIGPGWELHRFRHTFATERLRAGTPLEIVSLALGHATLEQTRGYAEIVRSDIARELARTEGAFTERVTNRAA